MPTAVRVPRVNNNDDEVKLVELRVGLGAQVTSGQVLAAVETDKALVDVESPVAGFVIAVHGEVDTMARVGTVLIWLGESAAEAPPAEAAASAVASNVGAGTAPTAKARSLLQRYGLQAAQVPASGDRLSAADVEQWIAARGLQPVSEDPAADEALAAAAAAPRDEAPRIAGRSVALRPDERGMMATVTWARDHAVPGYIELPYDSTPWTERAQRFASEHSLLLNPLLAMMAWRLVELAVESPRLNATIVRDQRHEYTTVNLGFTVQAGDVLYLAVVRDAPSMDELEFVRHLSGMQRRAAAHQLTAQETQGATIAFSSMARWDVSRHIPILAPHTALMVAHAVDGQGQAVLGATYDHRVLHGAAVAALLRKLGKPRT
jgi:pyruvate/2-oxoglutarate dehydrogenase complex dihydrolipoamide acyltransferase (E2) component